MRKFVEKLVIRNHEGDHGSEKDKETLFKEFERLVKSAPLNYLYKLEKIANKIGSVYLQNRVQDAIDMAYRQLASAVSSGEKGKFKLQLFLLQCIESYKDSKHYVDEILGKG